MSNIVGLLGNKILWIALAFGALFGAYKYEGYQTKAAKQKVEALQKSLSMAEVELDNAAVINKGALDQVAAQAREVERQKLIAAAEAKRSRDRAWALAKLQKEIANAPDASTISNALELIVDAERLRSAVPGSGPSADSSNENPEHGAPDNSGRDVPTPTAPAS